MFRHLLRKIFNYDLQNNLSCFQIILNRIVKKSPEFNLLRPISFQILIMKEASSVLSSIVIFCRHLQKTTGFYSTVLGLKVTKQSQSLTELRDSKDNIFLLKKHLTSEAVLSKGYSPILSFSVKDFQSVCDQIKLYQLPLDGEIISNDAIKMATFRGVEGQIISITNYFEQPSVDLSKEQAVDATTEEIKRILSKIKP